MAQQQPRPTLSEARYRRVLLKISGEALMGERAFGHDPAAIARIAEDVRQVHAMGVELCLVVGGGNIFRGTAGAADGIERANADGMGMLATAINALALQSMLETLSVPTRVQSAIRMDAICEPFIRRRAIRHMEKGRVVICAGGSGNPYFTTDTAAVLRAAEVDAEIILMAKQGVDGVYDDDPKKNPDAVRYEHLSYDEALRKNLRVMDQTAIALCRENDLPIIVFDMNTPGNICKVASGEDVGTKVGS